jgi:hypothetical protein
MVVVFWRFSYNITRVITGHQTNSPVANLCLIVISCLGKSDIFDNVEPQQHFRCPLGNFTNLGIYA